MPPWLTPERRKTARVPGDERDSLESWLEYHRATLLTKCAGLTPGKLVTRSCPPSPLSLLGLVRHMAEVESWFHVFDGQPEGQSYGSQDRPDADFEDVDPERADQDLAVYQASVERSRAAVIGRSLDDLIPQASKPTSLRWVYQHMIEEYARHNGHADLIRERIDGVTGS
ncbi:MAG TPA: DinB family protein [Streptosporangiaceae bacterium]